MVLPAPAAVGRAHGPVLAETGTDLPATRRRVLAAANGQAAELDPDQEEIGVVRAGCVQRTCDVHGLGGKLQCGREGSGLPEPLPAMPYALLATDGRLFAGLSDGQLWESRDGGDTWTTARLQGDTVAA
jgi:hypothetical protein